MKDQYIAQVRISNSIHQIEDDIDGLIAKVSGLLADMTEFRIAKNLDANVGHRAIARIADAQHALIDVRSKTIGAHADMKKIMEERADFPVTCPKKTGFLQNIKAA